jgi:hypothetical protein
MACTQVHSRQCALTTSSSHEPAYCAGCQPADALCRLLLHAGQGTACSSKQCSSLPYVLLTVYCQAQQVLTLRQGFQSTTQMQALVEAHLRGSANKTASTSSSHVGCSSHVGFCCVVGTDSASTNGDHTSSVLCCDVQKMLAGRCNTCRKQVQQQVKPARHWQTTFQVQRLYQEPTLPLLLQWFEVYTCTAQAASTCTVRKSLSLGAQLTQAAAAEHAIRSNLQQHPWQVATPYMHTQNASRSKHPLYTKQPPLLPLKLTP